MNFKWSYFRFARQLRLMSSGKPKNHYDSLGIPSSSTQGEVKTAYYKLSMQYHPDKNQSAESSEKFRDITEAYEVLGNAKTRRLYDKGLSYGSRAATTTYDTADRFHRSRETRSRPPPPTGRTPIYNFDEWSKSHYGATFRRQMDHKRQMKVNYMRRQKDLSDAKAERLMFFMTFLLLAGIYFFYDRTDYDKVDYRNVSYQRSQPEKKD